MNDMKSIWPKVVTLVMVALFAGVMALTSIYPYRPKSAIGWGMLFIFALPIWIVLEFVGGRIVNSKFITGLGRTPRIILGVFAFGGYMVIMIFAFRFLEPFTKKFGL